MNNFTVKLKAMLDTKPVEKQLKVLSEKQVVKITADGSQINTVTKTMQDDMGKVYKSIEKVNLSTKKTTTSMQGMAVQTEKVKQGFVGIIAKVSKFLLATTIISGFTTVVYESINAVKKFDDVLTEFKKVSDLDGEGLSLYTQKLGEMGKEVARTRTEMLSASTEFIKAGYTEDDSAILSKVATLFQNIADSEMSAGQSASFIISQMKAFNITANEAETIINKVNEVSNRFAVSSTDISSGLTKSSASLATYGNTIEQSVGLITAGTEIMTGQAGKVARGLKSQYS